ncbi:hypothetical protein A3F34_02435 [Candidatus Roizmanbacteria bacterium RIFCSPHIGHO2_12_FULL_44_10]|uniref:Endonuclease III n=1 Tax=Candidatus Roizmanbacteria bacterium RIFCSPHIGHO2_12_FULL_44_10 TaxID=1802054 RepID=A0A1F7I5X4_9BACT|nr:MAG: hypothetical protein A3F34_02435 [Candidatus Roizmanbacteria bacterium RIFCSPHIGHO2_12_FULL_44_10]
MTRQERADIVNKTLKKLFPKADTVLHWSNPWELTVAVVLSAQCTDKKVNEVTEKLFKKYSKLADYVNAKEEEFQQGIHSTGFYKAKTRHILGAARKIQDDFGGTVPQTMEELTTLPGVARKTGNVILDRAFGKTVGIAVDTHVIRLSRKFGLTDNTDQNKIEQDLMKLIPPKDWMNYTYRTIEYGRKLSPARKVNDTDDPISIALKNLH